MHTAPTATQPPLPRQRHQRQPGQRRDREAQERRVAHRRRRGQPRPDQPHRPDPLVVGAADAVGVVVGVVDADHQRDGDDQREQRPHRLHRPRTDRRPGADQHRGDRGRQRPRPRSRDPLPRRSPRPQAIDGSRAACRGHWPAAPPRPAGTGRCRPAASCPLTHCSGTAAPSAASPTIRAARVRCVAQVDPAVDADHGQRAVARPQVVDGDPGVVGQPERVPEQPVGEVDAGRVAHRAPELVLAAVVAVLLSRPAPAACPGGRSRHCSRSAFQ